MTDRFYFDHPNVSASNLKDLRREYYGDDRDLEALYKEAFLIGSIVDSKLTENGRPVEGATKELELLATKLVTYMLNDPVIKMLVDNLVGQFRFFKAMTFEYDGAVYTIRAKCKFDGYSRRFRIAVEYKTTACTTDLSFIASIDHLNYDLSAAWYMDVAKIDRLWIIAISKKNYKIFKLAIQRGDKIYNRGKEKYCRWAFLWVCVVEAFCKHITPNYETEEIRTSHQLLTGLEHEHTDRQGGADSLPLLSGLEW